MPLSPPQKPPDGTARVVLDTNASLALFLWDDPRCAGLRRRIEAGLLEPILDRACLEEWERVLDSPLAKHADQRRQANTRYALHLTLVETVSRSGVPRCRDPDDQKFLALAASGGATILYTRDKDLLRLRGLALKRMGLLIEQPDDAA